METPLICSRCQKEIKPKENFIEIIEWNNQKLILKNYVHKICWELFMDQQHTKQKALGMMQELMEKVNLMRN